MEFILRRSLQRVFQAIHCATQLCDLPSCIMQALRSFQGCPHRHSHKRDAAREESIIHDMSMTCTLPNATME